MHHDLKSTPEHHKAVRLGLKPYEVRKNDRGYMEGDTIAIREHPYHVDRVPPTARGTITHVLRNFIGLKKGYVVLGVRWVALMVLFLVLAAPAQANVITAGTWVQMPPPCECGDSPVSNASLDGKDQNGGYQLAAYLGMPNLEDVEYLSAPDGFTFEDNGAVVEFYSRTAFASALDVTPAGILRLIDGLGHTYTSNGEGRGRFMAFRLPPVISALGTTQRVFVGGEDLTYPLITLERGNPVTMAFGDFNDHMFETSFFTPNGLGGGGGGARVPEPAAIALFGLGALGLGARVSRRRVIR